MLTSWVWILNSHFLGQRWSHLGVHYILRLAVCPQAQRVKGSRGAIAQRETNFWKAFIKQWPPFDITAQIITRATQNSNVMNFYNRRTGPKQAFRCFGSMTAPGGPSYARSKLCLTDSLTYSLTGVKCRATSVANNLIKLIECNNVMFAFTTHSPTPPPLPLRQQKAIAPSGGAHRETSTKTLHRWDLQSPACTPSHFGMITQARQAQILKKQ